MLFIIADQHSGKALGWVGHPMVKTPNLDKLASQGTLFLNAFAAGLPCSPSRASILTGMFPHSHGVRLNDTPLGDELTTFAEVLKRHGYKTAAIGKMHEGKHPTKYGFDLWIGYREHLEYLRRKGYKNVKSPIVGSLDKAKLIPTPFKFPVGRAGLRPEDGADAFFATKAIEFLERTKGEPFLLYLSFHGPHDPYTPPPPYDSLYDPKRLPLPKFDIETELRTKPERQAKMRQHWGCDKLTEEQRRILLAHYLGMVTYTDHQVGRVLRKLSELGLEENTLVIYTADHGDMMGEHGMFLKGSVLYEPVVKVPLIIRLPKAVPAGRRVHELVSNVDLLPTILELLGLGAEIPSEIQGRSLVPLLRGRPGRWREVVFCEEGVEGWGRIVMARTGRWKLTQYTNFETGELEPAELYDLRADPGELRNLVSDQRFAPIVKRLFSEIERWDMSTPHAPLSFPWRWLLDSQRRTVMRRMRRAFDLWTKKHKVKIGP